MPLRAQITKVAALRPGDVDAMWALFEGYYADVTRGDFERDLAPKHHVILLREGRELRGFSTLEVQRARVRGRRCVALFSGDTIVDRRHWGDRALHRAFFRYAIQLKAWNPLTPVYWFLITKGYKTYLLLARNFPEHWPRRGHDTPADKRDLIDHLARARFGELYVPERGVLRHPVCRGRLRPTVAPVDPATASDPDVRFFLERNPGAPEGDELCCIGHVGLDLALRFGRKQAQRAMSLRAMGRRA